MTYQQARVGHHEYLRRLTRPDEVHDIDPAVLPYRERVHRIFASSVNTGSPRINAFTHPVTHQCYNHLGQKKDRRSTTGESDSVSSVGGLQRDATPSVSAASAFGGVLESREFPSFGTVTAEHNDLLSLNVDTIIVPLTPNCMPHAGIGLQILERGGPPLLNAVLSQVKDLLETRHLRRMQRVNVGKPSSSGAVVKAGGGKAQNDYAREAGNLQCGDVIQLPSFGAVASPTLTFVVLPYFYDTVPVAAAHLFRRAVHAALSAVNRGQLDVAASCDGSPRKRTVGIPVLGTGQVHGFQRGLVLPIMMTETVELLLQLHTVTPHYGIQTVRFVASRRQDANAVASALRDLASRWLPEYQMESASSYWERRSRRIVTVSRSIVRRSCTFEKVSFARRVPRRLRAGSRLPKIERQRRLQHRWRRYRVQEGPPLQVYSTTGAVGRSSRLLARRVAYHVPEAPSARSRSLPRWRMSKSGMIEGDTAWKC